jgi:predicted MFS family arabinose efflux permease
MSPESPPHTPTRATPAAPHPTAAPPAAAPRPTAAAPPAAGSAPTSAAPPAEAPPAAPTSAADRGNFAWTLVAVATASAALPFSVTGAAVALPALSAQLGSAIGATQWVQNAFNLTFASMALACGSLADRFGRRRVLLAGIGTVAGMALLIALSSSLPLIDVLRAAQGCGGAAVLASGAAVLAHAATGRRRQLAFGPVVAGALVDAAGWRAVFFAVAAVALAALLCAHRAPESRNPAAAPLDWAGLTTFTAGLASVSFVFVGATTRGWASAAAVVPLLAAVMLLAAFVVVEARDVRRAMFDVRLFRRADFVAVVCQPFAVTLAFVVLLVYLPPYLQGLTGRDVLSSGLLLVPLTVPVLVTPLLGGWLGARTSLRAVLTLAAVLNAAGCLGLLTLTPHTTWLGLAGPLLLCGLGVGLAFGVMDNAAVSTVPVANAGAAAGIFNTVRLAAESIAVAGAAAVLTNSTAAALRRDGVPGGRAGEIAGHAVQGLVDGAAAGPVGAALTSAFHLVAVGLAALSLVGAALTYRALRPGR